MNLVIVKYIAICIITSGFLCTGTFKERYLKKNYPIPEIKYILYMFFERSCREISIGKVKIRVRF